MPNATVITTSDPTFSETPGTAASQGMDVIVTGDPLFTGQITSAFVYKMRAWDTVAGQYIFWQSFGDTTTPPPTLNPVISITATKGVKTRTV